jgi:hypothetical protein
MHNNCYKYTKLKYVENFFNKNFYLKRNFIMLRKIKIYKKTQVILPYLLTRNKFHAIFVFTKIGEVHELLW